MSATTAAPRRRSTLMPLIVALIILAVIITLATLLTGTAFTAPAERHAVWLSADIAFAVQFIGATLLIALRKWNVMAAWGMTVLLRFAALAVYGFSLKALGLPATPALISLVTFFFVTTLAEPWLIRS
jgi:hypothetical protein